MAADVRAHASSSRGDALIAWLIAIALIGSACLLDPLAEASFDAPKRFIVLFCATAAGAVLCLRMRVPAWHAWSSAARSIVALLLLGALGLLIATIASPHPTQAWSTLRTMALFALLLPLGASTVLDNSGRRLLYVAAIAVAINACISLVQRGGWVLPIPMAQVGGRFPSGALLGNEAYVALAAALTAAACAALALNTKARTSRAIALGLAALCIAVIAANRQLTSAVALGAAIVAIVAVRMRARWIVWSCAALVLIALTSIALPSLRASAWLRVPGADTETYQTLTTYRLAAWAAAEDMVRERPWTGYGPGTYASEAQAHRLAAEVRLHERLQPPPNASAFVYAHQEYLQLAAEAGIPTLIAFVLALGTLIAGVLRRARSPGPSEPLVLLGVLVAGAVAALAWFPLQIPFTAVVLLLACGRAFRLVAQTQPT